MLVLNNTLQDVPIMSLQTGAMLARAVQQIIDPRNLFIVAFYCKGKMLGEGHEILHTSDVREVGPMGLIVDSSDKIMPPDDLVRLKGIIRYKFDPLGKQVVDDSGRKLGNVVAYVVDTKSFYITKLHVRPGFFEALGTAQVIIDRSQIISVTDKKILVKAPTIKNSKRKSAATPNPFRAAVSRPQPDMTDLNN